ncbi:hypothetical protein CHUAL_013080 [Chamberlinius hualienensis]
MVSMRLLLILPLLTLVIYSDGVETSNNHYPTAVHGDYSQSSSLIRDNQKLINTLKFNFVKTHEGDQSSEKEDDDEDKFSFINQKIIHEQQSRAKVIAQTIQKYLQEKSTSIDEIAAAESQVTLSTKTDTPIEATESTTLPKLTSPTSKRTARVITKPIKKIKTLKNFYKKTQRANRNRQSTPSTKKTKSNTGIVRSPYLGASIVSVDRSNLNPSKLTTTVKNRINPNPLGDSIVAANHNYLKNRETKFTTKTSAIVPSPGNSNNRHSNNYYSNSQNRKDG